MRVDVDPDRSPAKLLCYGARRSGSKKRIEHHVLDEGVELQQPPRQLLRKGSRVSELLGILARKFPRTKRPLQELVAFDLPGTMELFTGPGVLKKHWHHFNGCGDERGGWAHPASPGRPARYVLLVPHNGGLILPTRAEKSVDIVGVD